MKNHDRKLNNHNHDLRYDAFEQKYNYDLNQTTDAFNHKYDKGRVALPKRMNFRKNSRGGGSFPIQKFIVLIFAIINGSSVMNSGKKPQYEFTGTFLTNENRKKLRTVTLHNKE